MITEMRCVHFVNIIHSTRGIYNLSAYNKFQSCVYR